MPSAPQVMAQKSLGCSFHLNWKVHCKKSYFSFVKSTFSILPTTSTFVQSSSKTIRSKMWIILFANAMLQTKTIILLCTKSPCTFYKWEILFFAVMVIWYHLQFNGFRTMESIHISFQILDTCLNLWNKDRNAKKDLNIFIRLSSFQNLVLGIYHPYLCLNEYKWPKKKNQLAILSSKAKFWWNIL